MLIDPTLYDQLRFFRLIEERNDSDPAANAGAYTLACGHQVLVAPKLPNSIQYLPCPECAIAWNNSTKGPQPL